MSFSMCSSPNTDYCCLFLSLETTQYMGLPGGSDSKESACNAEDQGLIPGSARSPGEGNGKPLQYSCLENSMDRGAWWTAAHGITRVRHN